MRNADGLHDGEDHRALDDVAGEVCSPWIVWLDVELGDVAISVTKMGGELVQHPTIP